MMVHLFWKATFYCSVLICSCLPNFITLTTLHSLRRRATLQDEPSNRFESELAENHGLPSLVIDYDTKFVHRCNQSNGQPCDTKQADRLSMSEDVATDGKSTTKADCYKSLSENCGRVNPVGDDSDEDLEELDSEEEPDELIVDEFKNVGSAKKKLVCYYGSWATYRLGDGKYTAEMIDANLCTHLIYSFAGLNRSGEIISLDAWNDFSEPSGLGSLKKLTELRARNPRLKVLIGIGGWNEGSTNYSRMVSKPERRAKFVGSVIKFLDKHQLDGIDFDWEYPSNRGGKPSDKRNFISLLRDLRRVFGPKKYLLTAAVGAGKGIIESAYDIPKMARYLNLIGLMTYDYHAHWDRQTGMNAPLFAARGEAPQASSNVDWSVRHWIEQGAKPHQLVLGIGLYGHSFTLNSPDQHGLNAPANRPGRAGPFTKAKGSLSYYEICSLIKNDKWRVVRPEEDQTPYAYKGNQWVSYDDKISIQRKVSYALHKGLGGVMVWSIEQDDFMGKCHNQKYPLIKTIRSSLGLTKSVGRLKNASKSTSAPDQSQMPLNPATVPVCGSKGQWWFPGPGCSQYYDCTSGIAILHQCSAGLYWNQSKRQCNNDAETKSSCRAPSLLPISGKSLSDIEDMVVLEEEEEAVAAFASMAVDAILTTASPQVFTTQIP